MRSASTIRKKVLFAAIPLAVAAVGTVMLLHSHAVTPTVSFEAETGTVASGVVVASDATASGGQYVRFPAATSTGTPVPTGIAGNWTLKFNDDFNGSALDTTKWAPYWFSSSGTMNNVTTSPANVAVTGGNLVLTLSSSNTGALVSSNPNGGANPGFQFAYGFAEARIYFPGSSTTTAYNWPAWWTDGQSWPANGEIDIAEILGGKMTSNYHHAVNGAHVADNSGTISGGWMNGYHTYAVNRQAGKNDIYFDGNLVRSYSTNEAGSPQYFIINVGAGDPVLTGTASQVKVDYVRFWQ